MHVIHLLPLLIPETNGMVGAVCRLCEQMGQQSISLDLLALQSEANGKRLFLPNEPVHTQVIRSQLTVGITPLWAPNLRKRLAESIANDKQVIVHSNGCWLPTNATAMHIALQRKVHLIVTPHGMLEPWALNNSRLKKRLVWQLFQKQELERAQVLHATSMAEAENLRQLGVCQPIAVIPNGVELPPNPVAQPQQATQKQRTLLFLSRVHPKKGLLNLVAALKQVDLTGWHVVIAGPDENGHQQEVETAISAAHLQEKITFVGPVDGQKKWTWYQQAALFVLPTFSENFGIVVAEALAAGVPVITTKGAPWQELETHHCGWWIDIGVEPLAQALKTAMRLTDEERTQMGKNGRKLVEQNYSWSDVATKMAAVYRWMFGNSSKPECIWG